jgi:hypothetical protein
MAEWLREMSVGQWYQADAEPFEVVGVDVSTEIVLIQHFDGTLGEIDFDSWSELKARPIPPPEDYSGAMDMAIDDHDGLETDAVAGSNRWDSPLDLIDQRDL